MLPPSVHRQLTAMQERNEVVDELIKEALELQMKPDPESAVATFMPSKKRLITGVLPGERRHQRRATRQAPQVTARTTRWTPSSWR